MEDQYRVNEFENLKGGRSQTQKGQESDAQRRYGDILGHSYPFPLRHARMPVEDRAAQFAPFAALTGYDAVLAETARLTQNPVFLTEESLEELRLRYITLRMKNGEIRQNYYFFAGLKPGAAVRGTCDEGRLEWVPYDSVLKREMPFTAKTVLRHYLRVGCRTRCIYGSVTEAEDSAFTELAEF